MAAKARTEKPGERRARLAARLREISAEIRDYPQPIARCDAQLAGLVEERSRLQDELQRLDAERRRIAEFQGW